MEKSMYVFFIKVNILGSKIQLFIKIFKLEFEIVFWGTKENFKNKKTVEFDELEIDNLDEF